MAEKVIFAHSSIKFNMSNIKILFIINISGFRKNAVIKYINNGLGVFSAQLFSRGILNTLRLLFIFNTSIQFYFDGLRPGGGHLTY